MIPTWNHNRAFFKIKMNIIPYLNHLLNKYFAIRLKILFFAQFYFDPGKIKKYSTGAIRNICQMMDIPQR
jgi:hypothetical protein